MKGKLLFFAIYCVIFLVSCSAQEDYGNLSYESGKIVNDDTIAKPLDANSIIVVNDPIVAKNSIVAHRGAWKKNNFPQNSIASLKEAIRLECKGSEFDILLTADDSLVVCHDAIYNNLYIEHSKFANLVSLKLSNGEKLPTLRDFILVAQQNNTTTKLICELKVYKLNEEPERRKRLVEKTLETVKKLNAKQLIVYTSAAYDLLKHIMILDAFANTQYIYGNVSPEQLKLDKISAANYNIEVYTNKPEWITSAKANNVGLAIWPLNNDKSIIWSLQNKFDDLVTDEPELALKLSGVK